jgi:hypothetical protein
MCEGIRLLLPLHLTGSLNSGQRLQVEQHLAGCAACRAALAEWQELASSVRILASENAAGLPDLLIDPAALAGRTSGGAGPRIARWLGLIALLAGGLFVAQIGRGIRQAPAASSRAPATAVARVAENAVAELQTPVARAGSAAADGARPEQAARSRSTEPASGGQARLAGLSGSPSRGPAIRAAGSPAAVPTEVLLAIAEPTFSGHSVETAAPDPKNNEPPAATQTAHPIVSLTPAATETGAAPSETATLGPPSPSPSPAGGIVGLVVAVEDGLPRVEIPLRAWPEAGGAPLSTSTDSAGRFALPAAPGRWLVAVLSEQHEARWWKGAGLARTPFAAELLTVPEAGGAPELEFAIARNGPAAAEGRVTGAGGEGLAGALIVAVIEGGEGRPEDWGPATVSDAEGRYRLALPAGRYRIGAAARVGRQQLPSRWWPAANAIESAQLLDARPGSPLAGVDLQLP